VEKKLWISVGELSGDLIGEWLLRPLLEEEKISLVGILGPRLRRYPHREIFPMEDLQGMGLVEVGRSGKGVFRALREIYRFFDKEKVSSALLVSYGGVHIPLGMHLRKKGVQVAFLSPPQVWAWGRFRIPFLRKSADLFGVLFPFEESFYRRYGFPVVSVGHPAYSLHSLSSSHRDRFYLLPGSRPHEVLSHLPFFSRLVPYLHRFPYKLTLGIAFHLKDLLRKEISLFKKTHPEVEVVYIEDPSAFRDGAVAVAVSGTVTVELMVLKVPTVVLYRPHRVTYWAGKKLLKVPWISLVNHLAGKVVLKEVVDPIPSPRGVVTYVEEILSRKEEFEKICDELIPLLSQEEGKRRFLRFIRESFL
jgi:lipid-A-disaccharide synthase